MRSRRLLLLAFFLAVVLFWSVVPPIRAQGPTGAVYVSTDYELFGTSPLSGGGHVTWTLTGEKAQDLRAKLVNLFDEYRQIPRGFRYGGDATDGNQNGQLEVAEGFAYTDDLELELEGYVNGTSGSQIGYLHIDRSDLFDKDPSTGFQRSTAGFVGTGANSTQDLQIRFLFNGYSNVEDVTMPLATRTYVDALYNIFSFDARQSPTFTPPAAGFAATWPLLAEGGWHAIPYNSTAPAMWAGNLTTCGSGNESTCRYDPGTNASTRTSVDPVINPAPWLDLRFASSASVTFRYTGRVSAGARLLVEVALEPSYSTWSTLPNATWTDVQNTAPEEWQTASVDLSAYLGQKLQLRLRFDAGAGGSDRGFFVRDFAIHAPSAYSGPIVQNDAHYLIGVLSFSHAETPAAGLTVIRTPGGEILLDTLAWDTSAVPSDSVRFATFDAAESPQILFAAMVVSSYLISHLQEAAYDRYREAHPTVYRPAVPRVTWLHWIGRAAILLLILFYFLPTALFAIGIRVLFNGPAYWFLALTLTLSLGLGTRAYYQQILEEAPPPSAPEAPASAAVPAEAPAAGVPKEPAVVAHCTHCLRPIKEGEKTYRCTCGATYHLACASGLMRCSSCRKPIALDVVRETRVVSMRCQSCGEVQSIPEGADPRTVTCAACGGILRPLDAGKRYLLVASNPAIAFNWMKDLARGGKPILCVTPSAPDRLRLEFGLKAVTFLQVSSQAAGAVDPKNLDPQGLKAILPIAREGKGGVILYDGLDQVIAQSSLGEIVRFVRKANDMAFVHGVTVIARVGPGVLAEDEVRRLAQEFDETLDLSARL